jgi:hypothetical protein
LKSPQWSILTYVIGERPADLETTVRQAKKYPKRCDFTDSGASSGQCFPRTVPQRFRRGDLWIFARIYPGKTVTLLIISLLT